MPAFYNKEKSKHGTMTGTIISFPVQLSEDEPKAQTNLALIPAGYLRCDGRILFAIEYPELAAVLGTGTSSTFIKDGQALTDEQFQLPDLRNKNIRSTTSANIGQYNDLVVQDQNNEDMDKAGIALDVVQNIESPYELTYTGEFYIPPQTIDLRGEPRFSLDTGVYTSSVEVPDNAFQPHMHRAFTSRARQKDRNGNYFSARQKNHIRTKSSLNVCQWWENTAQPLCYYQWSELAVGGFNPGATPTETVIDGRTRYQFWGACFNGCSGFTAASLCLWPEDGTFCPEVNNQGFDFRNNNGQDCNAGEGSVGDTVTMGNITYQPEVYQTCQCIRILGLCIGGWGGVGTNNPNSSQLENFGPSYGENTTNLPFTTLDDESYVTTEAGVANITTIVGERGSDATHRHRIDFDSETAHTFQMRTRAAFARADSGLTSKITITKNNEPKADKYIQPFVVTEYLIKV